jgi:response regulator NasT
MNAPLRIVVADDEPDMREYFKKLLPRLGHKVVAEAESGTQLVEFCRQHQPDLVITDIKMPDIDGIDAAIQIYRDRPIPIILVSAYHDAGLIARAEADHIMGYLVKPIKQTDLVPALALAMRRFEQFQELQKEAADLRQALEDRKVIERAKGILMKRGPMDEPEAFKRLQKVASERSQKLVEVAKMIVVTEQALQPPG